MRNRTGRVATAGSRLQHVYECGVRETVVTMLLVTTRRRHAAEAIAREGQGGVDAFVCAAVADLESAPVFPTTCNQPASGPSDPAVGRRVRGGLRMALVLGVAACTAGTPSEPDVAEPAPVAAEQPETAAAPTPAPSCERCTDEACAPADARACNDLSEQYRQGRGVDFDAKRSGDLAETACTHGYAPACSRLAILYQDGSGGREHSDAKAAQWHERGCTAGAGIGCFNLAMMIDGGEHVPADPERAKPYYDKALALFGKSCDAGDYEWCANLGYMLASGTGVAEDDAKAVAAYERGCPHHQNNCGNLGIMKISGEGTPRDVEGGRAMLERGCDADSSWCCAFLGQHLMSSVTVADAERGVKALERACARKEKGACRFLGMAHAIGRGVAPDMGRAMALFEEACSLGDSGACHDAAMELVAAKRPQDEPRIRGLFDAGCRIGTAGDCVALGWMYATGRGGAPDPSLASAAWREACRRGDLMGCDEIVRLGIEPEVIASRRAMVFDHACRSGVTTACTVASK